MVTICEKLQELKTKWASTIVQRLHPQNNITKHTFFPTPLLQPPIIFPYPITGQLEKPSPVHFAIQVSTVHFPQQLHSPSSCEFATSWELKYMLLKRVRLYFLGQAGRQHLSEKQCNNKSLQKEGHALHWAPYKTLNH